MDWNCVGGSCDTSFDAEFNSASNGMLYDLPTQSYVPLKAENGLLIPLLWLPPTRFSAGGRSGSRPVSFDAEKNSKSNDVATASPTHSQKCVGAKKRRRPWKLRRHVNTYIIRRRIKFCVEWCRCWLAYAILRTILRKKWPIRIQNF